FQETGLVDIIAAIFSLLSMVGFLKYWKPRHVMHVAIGATAMKARRHSITAILKAWSPFLLCSVFIFVSGMPSLKRDLKISALNFPMPGLHNAVIRVPPVVPAPTPEPAPLDLNILALPGTAVFAGAFLSAVLFGMPLLGIFQLLGRTVRQLIPSLLAISFM